MAGSRYTHPGYSVLNRAMEHYGRQKANAGWVNCASDKVPAPLRDELVGSHSPNLWSHWHFLKRGGAGCLWCGMLKNTWTTSCPGSGDWISGRTVNDCVMHNQVDFHAGEWFVEPQFLDRYIKANKDAWREAARLVAAEKNLANSHLANSSPRGTGISLEQYLSAKERLGRHGRL